MALPDPLVTDPSVQRNFDDLDKRLAAIEEPEAWHTISLSNSSAYGGYTPAYRKLPGGTVEVRGELTLSTATTGTLIWTFPTGYRPVMRSGFVLNIGADGTLPVFDVNTDGTVTIGSVAGTTSDALNLAPIRFPTT